MLKPLDMTVVSSADYNIPDIDEPYGTFIENALAKARAVAKHTGLPALADDSGLCVEALDYAPGILSARFAGSEATDAQNNEKLLADLKNQTNRHAFYYCILVFVTSADDPQPLIADGRWHGEIAHAPIGENGFGYDPIFFDPKYQLTGAQLSPAQKNQISHRAIALKKLVTMFQSVYGHHDRECV